MMRRMVRLMKGLKLAFGTSLPAPPSLLGDEGTTSIVRQQSRGNLLLQLGRYSTLEDLQELRERVLRETASFKP